MKNSIVLLKKQDTAAKEHFDSFLSFANYNNIFPLTIQSVTISGDIYVDLRRQGELIDDVDILIAGIALANDLVLVTNNERHFQRIESLEIQNWIH